MLKTIFFTLILGSILLFFGASYFIYKIDMQEKFNNMTNRTYDLTFADDKLSTDHHNNVAPAVISTDIDNVRGTLGEFVKSIYSVGHLISPDTFCKLAWYDKWNAQIVELGEKNVQEKIKSESDLYVWKLDLLASLNADNVRQNSFFGTIKSLFSNPVLEKYKHSECKDNLF